MITSIAFVAVVAVALFGAKRAIDLNDKREYNKRAAQGAEAISFIARMWS